MSHENPVYSSDKEENDHIISLLDKLKTQEGELFSAIESERAFVILARIENKYKAVASEINQIFARLGIDKTVRPDHNAELDSASQRFTHRGREANIETSDSFGKSDFNTNLLATPTQIFDRKVPLLALNLERFAGLNLDESNSDGLEHGRILASSTPYSKEVEPNIDQSFSTREDCLNFIKQELPKEIAPTYIESYLEDKENYQALIQTINQKFNFPDVYKIVKDKILAFVGCKEEEELFEETGDFTPLLTALAFPESFFNNNDLTSDMANNLNMRGLSVKDALDLIPRYNGANIPLTKFLDGCAEAKSILPEGVEADFLKLIRIRLYGEALNIARSQSFTNLKQLSDFFEKMFGSAKTYYDLTGELAKVKQGRSESVVIYLNRLKEIEKEIVKAAQKEGRIKDETVFSTDLEKDCLKYFMRGLRWEIKARMGIPETYQKAQEEAIETEREFACSIFEDPSETEKLEEKPKTLKETRRVTIIEPRTPDFTCYYCGKPGHTVARCFALERNRQNYITPRNFNQMRNFVPPQPRSNTNFWGWNADNRQRVGFLPERNNFTRGFSPPQNIGNIQNSRALNRTPPRDAINARNNFSQNQNNMNKNPRENFEPRNSSIINCYYCGRPGHVQRDCYSYQRAIGQTQFNPQLRQGNLTNLSPTGAMRENSAQKRPIMPKQEESPRPTMPATQ